MSQSPANAESKGSALRTQASRSEQALRLLAIGAGLGLLTIVVFATQASTLPQFFSVVGVGALIAGASLFAGGLLGFLFGIPRKLQQEPNAARGADDQTGRQPGSGYQDNTNLEQISDWLTKILVGVGLTQLTQVPEALQRYSAFVAPGLGGFASSGIFGVAELVFFSISGFLYGYLWTRRYLAVEFTQAESEISSITSQLGQVQERLTEVERQARRDADALSLVQSALNPPAGTPPVPQTDLDARVAAASRAAKAQIFYMAQNLRSENWRDPATKPIMARTIPVFRALIASDKDEVYHANHGQLGFALKDQLQPAWTEAITELTRAIAIRDRRQQTGWLFYEFNRAVCRIRLDGGIFQDRASDPQVREQIVKDLEEASRAPDLFDICISDPEITKWLALNQVTLEEPQPD